LLGGLRHLAVGCHCDFIVFEGRNVTVTEWLRQAPQGARRVYHIGHLAVDRETDEDLALRAHEWMRASEAGLVQLHQRRGPDGAMVYFAIRTGELSC
jgi:hypothetical protein